MYEQEKEKEEKKEEWKESTRVWTHGLTGYVSAMPLGPHPQPFLL